MALLQWVLVPLLYLQASLLFGLAAFPGVWMCVSAWRATAAWPDPARLLLLCVLAALAYFLFGVALMLLVVATRILFFLKVAPGRYPFLSLGTIRWALYNTLILFVRFAFMNWVRVTPLLPLFYRWMGAKVGRNVHINTTVIGDACLLEIGDDAVIGGDATVIAHSAEKGHLIISPVKIGRGADIGLMAVIMPGVEVGDGAVVGAHAFVPKNTLIPPGTFWGGIPARQIRPAPEEPSGGGL